MALLLDLPSGPRRRLAELWGTGEETASLYRTITEPESLGARLAELPPGARPALEALRRAPSSAEELLARLPLSQPRLAEGLAALAELALALRAPEAGA